MSNIVNFNDSRSLACTINTLLGDTGTWEYSHSEKTDGDIHVFTPSSESLQKDAADTGCIDNKIRFSVSSQHLLDQCSVWVKFLSAGNFKPRRRTRTLIADKRGVLEKTSERSIKAFVDELLEGLAGFATKERVTPLVADAINQSLVAGGVLHTPTNTDYTMVTIEPDHRVQIHHAPSKHDLGELKFDISVTKLSPVQLTAVLKAINENQ